MFDNVVEIQPKIRRRNVQQLFISCMILLNQKLKQLKNYTAYYNQITYKYIKIVKTIDYNLRKIFTFL